MKRLLVFSLAVLGGILGNILGSALVIGQGAKASFVGSAEPSRSDQAVSGLHGGLFALDLLHVTTPQNKVQSSRSMLWQTHFKPHRISFKGCRDDQQLQDLLRKYEHAARRYVQRKKKAILLQKVAFLKDGMTLSSAIDDYYNYTLVLRRSRWKEDRPLDGYRALKNHYVWIEGDKIVMAANVMLMSPARQAELIDEVIRTSRPSWQRDDYRRLAERTRRVAQQSAFKLDCAHKAELDWLVALAFEDIVRDRDERVISPAMFDNLLTILRGHASFHYYQKLSDEEFENRFMALQRHQGRGHYSHAKLTRLLGLHVMGRREKNYGFRDTYAFAIKRAAKLYPTIPRQWIEEIIWIESGGDPRAISHAGAYGLMQIMPLVYLGQEKEGPLPPLAFRHSINPFNAATNIERGTAFLDKLRRTLEPHMRGFSRAQKKKAIFHAYNGGITRVRRFLKKYGAAYINHMPNETRHYLDKLADFPVR